MIGAGVLRTFQPFDGFVQVPIQADVMRTVVEKTAPLVTIETQKSPILECLQLGNQSVRLLRMYQSAAYRRMLLIDSPAALFRIEGCS